MLHFIPYAHAIHNIKENKNYTVRTTFSKGNNSTFVYMKSSAKLEVHSCQTKKNWEN